MKPLTILIIQVINFIGQLLNLFLLAQTHPELSVAISLLSIFIGSAVAVTGVIALAGIVALAGAFAFSLTSAGAGVVASVSAGVVTGVIALAGIVALAEFLEEKEKEKQEIKTSRKRKR